MAKVRVYELAKEFGVESKVVMVQLQEWGQFVRSASSTIEAPIVRRLRDAFAAKALDRRTPGRAAPLPPAPLPPLSRPGGPSVRSGALSPGPNTFSSAASGLDQWARPTEIRSSAHHGTGTKSLSDPATPGKPPAGPIHELIENWNLAERFAPDRSLVVRFLADHSKLATFDIDRIRRVRNQCSHPADLGWPQQYDFDMALTTARELRRRLEVDGH